MQITNARPPGLSQQIPAPNLTIHMHVYAGRDRIRTYLCRSCGEDPCGPGDDLGRAPKSSAGHSHRGGTMGPTKIVFFVFSCFKISCF